MSSVAAKRISDEDFIETWNKYGSPALVSRALNIGVRSVYERRARLGLATFNSQNPAYAEKSHKARLTTEVQDGHVIVFSDAHFWPGTQTAANRALIKLVKALQPKQIHCNGDAFDGARISRHPRIGFMESAPSVKDQLEATQDRLHEIISAAPKGCEFYWELGNHDANFEKTLAASAPEYEGILGMHLKDHFPAWKPCWSVWINDDVVIKHRWHNGIHGTYNNTLKGGKTILTGHLHSLKVTPWTDYNGTRYGVDTGTLADPWGDQFQAYMEENPRNWRSGFAVLTFWKGRLLMPELCQVFDEETAEFRGQVFRV